MSPVKEEPAAGLFHYLHARVVVCAAYYLAE